MLSNCSCVFSLDDFIFHNQFSLHNFFFKNSLDLDQDRHFGGPDVDTSGLQLKRLSANDKIKQS